MNPKSLIKNLSLVVFGIVIGLTIGHHKIEPAAPTRELAKLKNGLPDDVMYYIIAGFATNADGTTNYGRMVGLDTRTQKPVGE